MANHFLLGKKGRMPKSVLWPLLKGAHFQRIVWPLWRQSMGPQPRLARAHLLSPSSGVWLCHIYLHEYLYLYGSVVISLWRILYLYVSDIYMYSYVLMSYTF